CRLNIRANEGSVRGVMQMRAMAKPTPMVRRIDHRIKDMVGNLSMSWAAYAQALEIWRNERYGAAGCSTGHDLVTPHRRSGPMNVASQIGRSEIDFLMALKCVNSRRRSRIV